MTEILIGQPVLISIDHQQAGYNENYAIPQMGGYAERVERAVELVEAARSAGIPVIFIQERHARTLADFGRELDGSEGVHCVEDDPDTRLVELLQPWPDEYFVPKRRYSSFFGTDLEILLKGLGARTLVLCGALTDVCVHYTFVDAHQHDYHVRVAQDVVGGSLQDAHDASLRAMEYLQTGALRDSSEIIAAFGAYDGAPRPPVRSIADGATR
ncbi:MAG: cysteine hydrolase [Gaiellaceae bacterium MAG52_C11]|nr:cysteine hydrolase [Candidatus Gaiellasilicea maunaloa]